MRTTRRRRGLWALGALGVLLLGLRLALPGLLEQLLERAAAGALRAEFDIGDVSLRLREGEVILSDVVLRHGDAELARARTIALDADWGALLRGALAAERLRIENPELLLVYDEEGRFNWSGVLPEAEETDAETEPSAAFRVRVETLGLGEGSIHLVDEAKELPDLRLRVGALGLEGLELERPEPGAALGWALESVDASDWQLGLAPARGEAFDFSIQAHAGPENAQGALPLRLELTRESGAHVAVDGVLRQEPLELTLQARWKGLRSRALLPFVTTAVRVARGTSEGELEIELTLAEGPDRGVRVRGRASHEDLELEDRDDPPTRLHVPRVEVALRQLRLPIPASTADPPAPISVHWSQIELVEPELELTLPETAAMDDDEPDSDPERESEGENAVLFEARVDVFSLHRGRLILHDEGFGADLQLTLGELTLEGIEAGIPEPGAPPSWALASVSARDWKIDVRPHQGEKIDFEFRVTTGPVGPDARIPLHVELQRGDDVELDVRGEVRPDPLAADLKLRWRGLDSARLAMALEVDAATIEHGVSQGELDLTLDLGDGPAQGLRIAGRVEHRELALELELSDGSRARIEVAGIQGDLSELWVPIPDVPAEPPEPVRVHWSRIQIDAPAVDATLAPPGDDDEGALPPEPEASAPGVEVRVDALTVRRGRLRWSDPALGARHSRTLQPIGLEAAAVSWPELGFRRALLSVAGLGSQEPLRIAGRWSSREVDLELRVKRVPLAPWNPEIARYSDYEVTRGVVSVDSQLKQRGDTYEIPTDVVLNRLRVTNEGSFQQTFGMSVSAAILLLSDSAGNIGLHLPVRGTTSGGGDTDVIATIAAAMTQALINAVGSALAVPIDIAGALLRRVGEVFFMGIGEAPFDPGESGLDADARLVLDTATRMIAQTQGAKLILVPEMVSDDLRALGDPRGDNLLDTVTGAARSLFSIGGSVETDEHGPLARLARQRLDAITRYARPRLDANRIVRENWDGRVLEGLPRVLLRLKPAS